jgi:hypothetical protein
MPSTLKYKHKQLLASLKDIEDTKTDTSEEERKLLNFTKQLEQSTSKHDNDIEELKTRLASLQTKLATAEREKQVAILWHRNHIEKIQTEIEVKKNPKKSLRYKQLSLKIEEVREEMLSVRKNNLDRGESLQPFEEEWYREGGFETLKLSLKDYQDNKYRLQEEEKERLAEIAERERKERASRPKQQKQVQKRQQLPLSEEETWAICKDVLNDIINEIISANAKN